MDTMAGGNKALVRADLRLNWLVWSRAKGVLEGAEATLEGVEGFGAVVVGGCGPGTPEIAFSLGIGGRSFGEGLVRALQEQGELLGERLPEVGVEKLDLFADFGEGEGRGVFEEGLRMLEQEV